MNPASLLTLSPVPLSMQKTLLAIFAHPDDESFGPGATLAKYALDGAAVHYLCGTRGEVGTVDAEHLNGFDSIGDMRWAELTAAAKELRLAGIHHLGFRDSGMPGAEDNRHPQALSAQPVDVVAARIAHFIRYLRPQVVITHDPIGGYRHPDHIMLNKATVRAFEMLRDAAAYADEEGLPPHLPHKLYYTTFDKRFFRTAVRLLPLFRQDPRKFGRNKDIDLVSLTQDSFPIHARIKVEAEAADMQARASACHKSQMGPPRQRGLIGLLFRLSRRYDTFMQAYPPVPDGTTLNVRDLFEGLPS
jgi:N-acetyl-1-D-myo-inositol-2-amino-2-deoxy-alpha-D-glucopyranoside deacetylase/mycothiol S-conjugate amidase